MSNLKWIEDFLEWQNNEPIKKNNKYSKSKSKSTKKIKKFNKQSDYRKKAKRKK